MYEYINLKIYNINFHILQLIDLNTLYTLYIYVIIVVFMPWWWHTSLTVSSILHIYVYTKYMCMAIYNKLECICV